ncbi:hypothetical protein ACUTQ5_02580 [Serratia sp. NA_112.1]|uniref:hypothetical protein n=1 Tax=unclassified Serratia (in: enterobacteria) TaxID=2647522 RepID=UPI004047036B
MSVISIPPCVLPLWPALTRVNPVLMPALFASLPSPSVVFRELSGTGSPVPYTLALNWQPAVIDNLHTGGYLKSMNIPMQSTLNQSWWRLF